MLFILSLRKTYFFILLFSLGALIRPANAQALDTAFLYRISNGAVEDKSLALAYDGTANRPVLKPTQDYPTYYWRLKRDKYGNYRLINYRQGTDFSVEVVNDTEKNKLTLGTSRDVASQAWRITRNQNGTYRITCLWLGTDKALDVVTAGEKANELILAPTGNVAGQQWKLVKLPKPAVEVKTPAAPVAAAVGAAVSIDTEPAYRLSTQWRGDGFSLGVTEDLPDHPRLVPSSETVGQYWRLIPGANGFYRLVNQGHTDRSLDIVNDGKNNNLPVLAPSNEYSGQFWKLTPDPAGGFYRLTSLWQGDGKSLDVVNDGTKTELILNPTGQYSGQYWKLIRQTGSLVVVESKPSVKSNLSSGEELLPGMKLVSPNGQYTFIQQKDGNLVLYNGDNKPIWASDQYGKDVQRCIMQPDGNLVQYLHYKVATWASATHGHEGAYLEVQDDGNVVIYGKNKEALWSTNTQEK